MDKLKVIVVVVVVVALGGFSIYVSKSHNALLGHTTTLAFCFLATAAFSLITLSRSKANLDPKPTLYLIIAFAAAGVLFTALGYSGLQELCR